MIAVSRSDIGDTAAPVVNNVWDVADVVEHVAAGEQEDSDKGDGCPEIATVNDGLDNGEGDADNCNSDQQSAGHATKFYVVERTRNRGFMCGVLADEVGDCLGGNTTNTTLARSIVGKARQSGWLLLSEVELIWCLNMCDINIISSGRREQVQDGSSRQLQLNKLSVSPIYHN